MKKIITLLILPLTLLVADFTLVGNILTPNTPDTSNTQTINNELSTISNTNKYLEQVNLPTCDIDNPEVQFIRNNTDWNTINSTTKRIFCVSPGNYTSLRNIKITTSGTSENRRYIILDNGNDTHPGKLDKTQLANFALLFDGASYWTIDRGATVNRDDFNYILENGSSHNIFNRILQINYSVAFHIKHGCHYNTIQNSRFDTMTQQGFKYDLSSIQIQGSGSPLTVLGTKIINNEFVNAKPGRLNRYVGQICDFTGTIFDSNNVEYTDDLRTDCHGNLNPNGNCLAGESSGFSAKYGSLDPNKPVIFSNNHVWGFLPTDPTMEPTLSGQGIGFIAYVGASYIHIKNNVIFNGSQGISIADRYDKSHGTEYAEITGNLIVNCGALPYSNDSSSINISQAYHATVKNNTIINPIGHYAKIWYNYAGVYYGQNIVVNPDTSIITSPNNATVTGLGTDTIYPSANDGGFINNYTFTTDKFTNKPRIITLENVLKP